MGANSLYRVKVRVPAYEWVEVSALFPEEAAEMARESGEPVEVRCAFDDAGDEDAQDFSDDEHEPLWASWRPREPGRPPK